MPSYKTSKRLRMAKTVSAAIAEDDVFISPDEQVDNTENMESRDARQYLSSHQLEIMAGSLVDLPAIPTNKVRIFISSTFQDFKAERNILHKKAYPKLQNYCSENGIDFQVVDMRWGVTDDNINAHQVSDLCIKEIQTCQRVSRGPNFVMFLGNRYGYQPFKARLEANKFELFASLAEQLQIDPQCLLQKWFKKDDNYVPSHYILQSIQNADQAEWPRVSSEIRAILRQCASAAKQLGYITAKEEKTYYISVTEEEIQQGLSQSDEVDSRVLCFRRHLEGLKWDYKNPEAAPYLDLTENKQLDKDAQQMNRDLIQNFVPNNLSADNIMSYMIPWGGKSLEASLDVKHASYLDNFCKDFVSKMKSLISKPTDDYEDDDAHKMMLLYTEVLHHAKFAQSKVQMFSGRHSEMDLIKDYLKSKPRHCSGEQCGVRRCPFVVYGRSGIGKTALLASAAKSIREIDPAFICLRFFGTSPQSSNICDVLKTLIYQISINFSFQFPKEELLENIGDIRREFWSLIERVGANVNHDKLVIILDSVDQLDEAYGAHGMRWVPKSLPENVYLLMSMLSDRFTCLENTKKRFPSCMSNFLELNPIRGGVVNDFIKMHLEKCGRRLTVEQYALLVGFIQRKMEPLYMKLVMDSAKKWRSYTEYNDLDIPSAVNCAITKLFETVETRFGRLFVNHALGYLTCGRQGVTDVEMEDVLSCDDKVLNEVYQYHDPPVDGIVRIPSLLWARLQDALKEYLAERLVDGKVVQAWYHRQFWEAAIKRYLEPDNQKEFLHANFARIFLQEDGIRRTIRLHQRENKIIEYADRGVTPQPLSVRNARKLNSLPYHLRKANKIFQLKESCYMNFKFLLIKLLAFKIGALNKELTKCAGKPELKHHEDFQLLKDLIQLSHDALWHDPCLLAFQVRERLMKCLKNTEALNKLKEGADKWIETAKIPLLLPSHQVGLASPDSPLQFNILIGYDGIISNDESMIACCWQERSGLTKIQVLNLITKEVVASKEIEKSVPFKITSDGRYFVYSDGKTLNICEMDGGDTVKSFDFHSGDYEKMTSRCLALSDTNAMAAVCVRFGKPRDSRQQWRTETWIFIIDIDSSSKIVAMRSAVRKSPDAIFFIQNNSNLLVAAKDQILILDVKTLGLVHQIDVEGDMQTSLAKLVYERSLFFTAIIVDNKPKVLIFNYETLKVECSENMHKEDDESSNPCALVCEEGPQGSMVMMVTKSSSNNDSCTLCTWDRQRNIYRRLSLTSHGFKTPSVATVTKDWMYAFVCWTSGHWTMVDLRQTKLKELVSHNIHNAAINYIHVITQTNSCLTMAQDHTLKLFDIGRAVKLMEDATLMAKFRLHRSNAVDKRNILDENEQCLGLTATNQYAISAPFDSVHGPRLWNLRDGLLMEEKTDELHQCYSNSVSIHSDVMEGRTHADVIALPNDILVYERKIRNSLSIFVSKDYNQTCAHKTFKDTFFKLIPPEPITNELGLRGQKLMLVRDKHLQIYSLPTLEMEIEIDFPPISADVKNIYSTGGKRRLNNYRVGITYDCRYFLIMNAGGSYGAKELKYFDIIDLKQQKYLKREEMSKFSPLCLMRDSITFLSLKEGADGFSSKFLVNRPSKLKSHMENGDVFTYSQAIYAGGFISNDGTVGVEFMNRTHSLSLWKLKPLEKKTDDLIGHMHELTACDFSQDNQHLVTGSNDKTVRLWSTLDGRQLCVFYTNAAVDNVFFNPKCSHIIVHCYAAPHRKRGILLEICNLKGKRKYSRFLSQYDL